MQYFLTNILLLIFYIKVIAFFFFKKFLKNNEYFFLKKFGVYNYSISYLYVVLDLCFIYILHKYGIGHAYYSLSELDEVINKSTPDRKINLIRSSSPHLYVYMSSIAYLFINF